MVAPVKAKWMCSAGPQEPSSALKFPQIASHKRGYVGLKLGVTLRIIWPNFLH